jgi:hypothetical protein
MIAIVIDFKPIAFGFEGERIADICFRLLVGVQVVLVAIVIRKGGKIT